MGLVFNENKKEERTLLCIINGKRSKDRYEHTREDIMVSLDQLREDEGFDFPDPALSVEERILDKFLKKALWSELHKLLFRDKVIIYCICYKDIPYTQRQISALLHISQVMVCKRHKELLSDLRSKLEVQICGENRLSNKRKVSQ